ncbi:vWA domain-containing protein [Desulfobacter sp. UBA2225]|uniref:vWA domain-containing protein n=1 Tax=Desulfobacter sp. UBA2225 TaxID=1961413 RepID=UPI0025810AF3|nr:vWA domain-containing protein [Desulfobacter sp. UBA2225]
MNSTDSYFNLVKAAVDLASPEATGYYRDRGGISAYWRKNLSPLETVELSNVLRALRKVAGFLGDNVGSVDWVGMSTKNKGRIVLDPEIIFGRYPISYEKMDILVGVVVHEALHRVVWSERVWQEAVKQAGEITPREKLMLSKIVSTGEDIYVDIVSQKSILGLYTAKVRQMALDMLKRIHKVVPSVDELLRIWWDTAFNKSTQAVDDVYREKLDILSSADRWLEEIAAGGTSVAEQSDITKDSSHFSTLTGKVWHGVVGRCDIRKDLYLELWKNIYEDIKFWRVYDFSMPLYSPLDPKEKTKGKKKRKPGGVFPLLESMDEVELELAVDSIDITPLIRAVVGDDDEVMPTSLWDFNVSNTHPMIDPHLVTRLKRIFEVYAERKFLINRGLKSGKVDARKLYRAPIDGRCFKEKQFRSEASWNIVLLVDASASMGGVKWRMVENTVAAIYTALKSTNNHFQAFGYFEIEKICMISRIVKDNKLLSLQPMGQTASGQAIIGAALQMSQEGGKRLLIHVTDGGSNCGCDVSHGINYCKNKKIDLATLGSGYDDRELMLEQYGESIRFLDSIEHLPGAIEGLLRKKILG